MNSKFLLGVFSLLIFSFYSFSQDDNLSDWPQFRGPDRTGISDEIVKDEIKSELLWKVEIGSGFSGMIDSYFFCTPL